MSGLFSLCEARSIREECSEASVILVANISSVKAYTGLALQMFQDKDGDKIPLASDDKIHS